MKAIAEKVGLSEQAVWEDLRKSGKQQPRASSQQPEVGSQKSGGNSQAPGSKLQASIATPRLDLVERRMFGLLYLMESAKMSGAGEYRKQIEKIAGGSFQGLLEKIKLIENDIAFEAESFYGPSTSSGQPLNRGWDMHMKELIANFEVDLINKELVISMGELRLAEKAGDTARVAKMAQKCQELSQKKASLSKGGKV